VARRLFGSRERKREIESACRRRICDIKTDRRTEEALFEAVEWIELAQDSARFEAV
jgi:hypothetical protein